MRLFKKRKPITNYKPVDFSGMKPKETKNSMKPYLFLTLTTIVFWVLAVLNIEFSLTAALLMTAYLVADFFRVEAYARHRERKAVAELANEGGTSKPSLAALEVTVELEGQKPRTFTAGL